MRNRRTGWFVVVVLAGLLTASMGTAQKADQAELLLQAASHKQLVEGRLEEAIQLYKNILTRYAGNRPVAAKVLVQMGQCYEKLGMTEAQKAYERVVREYADQIEPLRLARARLASITGGPSSDLLTVKLPPTDLQDLSLSPDGTKMAGLDYSIGQNIGVYDYATQRQELITHFDWSPNSHWTVAPIWSPDGKEVAFCQGDMADLRATKTMELRTSSLSGQSRLLYRNEGGRILPSNWLPNGKIIVALRRPDQSTILGLVPAAGGDFQALRSFPSDDMGGRSASPDGKFIVFAEGLPGARDLKIISTEGKSLEILTDHPADDVQPHWSPDGRHIVFLSKRNGGMALWGIAVKDGKAAGPPFLIKERMEQTTLANWTPQGLAYYTDAAWEDVFIMPVDAATGDPAGQARPVSYAPTGRNAIPVWSPDGRYLAFASNPAVPSKPGRGSIVVLPASGEKAREYPIPMKNFRRLALADLRWLPDGSALGFSGLDDKQENTLFRLTLASGEWKSWPLPTTIWTRIEWSRDGQAFLYAKHGPGISEPGILERNMATGAERYLFRSHPAQEGMAVFRGLKFSRNQQWLAFQSDNKQIITVEVETGKTLTIPSEQALMGPAWSPSGEQLLVLGALDNKTGTATAVFVVPAAGGPLKKLPLGNNVPKDSHFRSADWSPDGKQVALTVLGWKSEAFLIKNVIQAGQ